MKYQTPDSTCRICGKVFTNRGILRHIRSCLGKALQARPTSRNRSLHHLHITDKYEPAYFLHLLVFGHTRLKTLDHYLRNIWLECCGHTSAFTDHRNHFGDEIPFDLTIVEVFCQSEILDYEYDFGSTTNLVIKQVDVYPGTSDISESISLLCRNAPHVIPCGTCKKRPAEQVCGQCSYDGAGFLCDQCAPKHECGEEMLLPLTNSPRCGVCAYEGALESAIDNGTSTVFESPGFSRTSDKTQPTSTPSTRKRNRPSTVRVSALKKTIRLFCKQYLDTVWADEACEIVDDIAKAPSFDLDSDSLETWAAAILYSMAEFNDILIQNGADRISEDLDDEPTLDPGTICEFFNVKPKTIITRAMRITEVFYLDEEDDDFEDDDPFFNESLSPLGDLILDPLMMGPNTFDRQLFKIFIQTLQGLPQKELRKSYQEMEKIIIGAIEGSLPPGQKSTQKQKLVQDFVEDLIEIIKHDIGRNPKKQK
jgi:hypothetical protein